MERADFVFFDSGTGGIPYMLALKKKLPAATCVYLGDTKNFPYGEKTSEQVTECASSAVRLIVEKWNPRTLVIACNTISVTALASLRRKFPSLPIVGTVPAIKLGAKVSKNKRIGFLATNATVNNPYSQKLIDDFASDCEVFKRGDPDLVAFIEHDFFESTESQKEEAVRPAVDFFKKNGCDTIILSCTHFTHIAETMQRVAGKDVMVIDSRDGVTRQALLVLEQNRKDDKKEQCECSDDIDYPFFVTAATKEQEEEYRKLCMNCGIQYGGIVS